MPRHQSREYPADAGRAGGRPVATTRTSRAGACAPRFSRGASLPGPRPAAPTAPIASAATDRGRARTTAAWQCGTKKENISMQDAPLQVDLGSVETLIGNL